MQLPATLTLAQAPQALGSLQAALRARTPGPEPVWVDAGALQEFDTSVLAVLMDLQRAALGQGLAFEVRQPPAQLRQLAALYGVDQLLHLQEPEATAVPADSAQRST